MTSREYRRGEHADLSLQLAIRELVGASAYCADRRDGAGQMDLFTPTSSTRHFPPRWKCLDSEDVRSKANPSATGRVGSPPTLGDLRWSRQ
jgi:hypothetical protein